MIRVLVVEDSLTVRRSLVEAIESAPGFEVAGEATDGEEAVRLCQRLRPDAVTMDIVLPKTSGLAATERIMAFCPTPILIVSGSDNRRELFSTYDALAAGAVDVLEKPIGDDPAWQGELLSALRIVSRIRVITHPRSRLGRLGAPLPPAASREAAPRPGLLAIGGSTGGPGALRTILGAFPRDFPVPVVVVLHVSEPFGLALAEWLDTQCALEVRCAREGEPLSLGGQVRLAPPDRHLSVRAGRLHLSEEPPRHSCRPSVDVLFESVAERGEGVVACLLTGMGRDGAEGLLRVRERGGVTIAQDEASSVVFGMPGEAVRLGAAAEVLPLERIAPRLLQLCARVV